MTKKKLEIDVRCVRQIKWVKDQFFKMPIQIKEEGNLKKGWWKKDGKWTTYNEDGSIKKVEEYKDGELVQ